MRLASGSSGRPDKPPASFAVSTSCRLGGRVTVVLPTIMPSTRRERAMPTTSSRSGKRKIGRDLEQHRRRPGVRRDAFAGIDHARQQIVEHGGLLHVAQARRVGRRDVDGDIARDRGEALDQPAHNRQCGRRILVGADVDADDAARTRAARAASRAQHGIGALRIKAEPIDHAVIGIEPKQPRPRIAGLRQRRDGADFDEAEADAQQRVRHFGVLVEARRDADRIGKLSPNARIASRLSSERPAAAARISAS